MFFSPRFPGTFFTAVLPSASAAGFFMPFLANSAADHSLPFALTVADRKVGSMMAGEPTHFELDRFATLADAMHAAVMLSTFRRPKSPMPR